jgi:hypothetical protein
MKNKFLLLLLSLFSLTSFAQTLSGPSSGNWILLDTNYTLGSFKEGKSSVKIHYKNESSSDLVTGTQFRLYYDTVAFSNPVVSSVSSSWSQYMSYHAASNYVTVSIVYTGSSTSFSIPDGEFIKIEFTHKSSFPTLTSISPCSLTGSPSYNSVASAQTGLDVTLSKHSYGANWIFPRFVFTTEIANVNGLAVKKMHLSLEKKVKTSSAWTQVKADKTNNSGFLTFDEIIDTTYYDTRIVIQGDTMDASASISVADAYQINKFVTGEDTPYGFDFYTSDVNGSKDISVSDVYGVFGKLAARFSNWVNGVPPVKFFTPSEFNTITSDSANSKVSTISGSANIIYQIYPGTDSVKYYVATMGDANATGFKVARIVPVEIVNPNNAPNWVIDYNLIYDNPDIQEIEVRLPKFTSVEEGNLVNIPIKVLNKGQKVGALQFGLFYDPDLLTFSNLMASEKAASWFSYFNPKDNVVEWGGFDPSFSKNLIDNEIDFITLQFVAQKPKEEWGKSPLYVVNKSAGDEKCRDLNMIPTEGVTQVLRVINGNPRQFDNLTCYPNPTTRTTNIEFTNTVVGKANLVVTDPYGRNLEVLLDENLPLGKFRYTLNMDLFSSGIYYVILTNGEGVSASKVALIK